MILCVRDMKLDSLYALTIYDYQKTVHDAIEEDVGFQADEASVRDIFAIIKNFLRIIGDIFPLHPSQRKLLCSGRP